ncbi:MULTISPECIES: hypothetical protein [unclassified Akkermansia]|uniref:hypothetical protein n=1 Tax=unclassified Akkermansia TaxID=2608915 RepID=UPI0011CBA81F|nr:MULTISPECIES: hypothetical protein [unclassified Akkermansia]
MKSFLVINALRFPASSRRKLFRLSGAAVIPNGCISQDGPAYESSGVFHPEYLQAPLFTGF